MRWDRREKGPGGAIERLRLELEDGLASDPRVLVDPALLKVLHAALRERLGTSEVAGVMLRAGFFHGLRDALVALHAGGAEPVRGAVATPPVAMALARDGGAGAAAGTTGCWPDPVEARAVEAAGISVHEPSCYLTAGYTSGWLSGMWEEDVLALEESCVACGAASCRFVARSAQSWCTVDDPRVQRLLDALPFDALWAVAADLLDGLEQASAEGAIDPESPAVHVWGPVMVVPYAGAETAVAVESVVRDPGARQVSVVVVDLSGVILDEGFGAVALEHTLDAIEAWGAEAILAGISPLSEPVVATLERSHLVLRKDLSEAIASAFQIAESQRRPA